MKNNFIQFSSLHCFRMPFECLSGRNFLQERPLAECDLLINFHFIVSPPKSGRSESTAAALPLIPLLAELHRDSRFWSHI